MKERARKDRARIIAEGYAPQPKSSAFMYAVVGLFAAGLGLAVFGKFYAIDMTTHPIWIGCVAIAVMAIAIVLWFVRTKRHNTAHGAEYDKLDA